VPPLEVPAPSVGGFEHAQVFGSKPGAGQGIGAQEPLEQEKAAHKLPAATKTVAKISSRVSLIRRLCSKIDGNARRNLTAAAP
jgi:hypothetical protein